MVPQGHNFFHLTGLLGTLVANRATVVRWTFTAVAGGIAGVRILSNFLNYTRLFQMCLFFVECICPKRKQRVSAKRNSLHPMQGNLKHTWHGAYGYYLTNLQASQEGSLVDRLTLSVTPIARFRRKASTNDLEPKMRASPLTGTLTLHFVSERQGRGQRAL